MIPRVQAQPHARLVSTKLVVAKLATHQAPRIKNAPQVSGKLFEAIVPRMTSPIAWIGRTLWIEPSQPGNRSAGKFSGENIRMKTTRIWLAMLATIGGTTDAKAYPTEVAVKATSITAGTTSGLTCRSRSEEHTSELQSRQYLV